MQSEATEPRGVLVTGFPGFIARRLVDRLLSEHPNDRLYLLVEPRFVFGAERACRSLEQSHPEFIGRWRVVVGDIRKPDLGIDPRSLGVLRERVTRVWHLAALYDLGVSASVAYAVNVLGTEHVLDLCATLPRLERLLYVSTCYVAGCRTGFIYEDELDCQQDFKNHYEATKFWAELKVQQRLGEIPTTIFRPSIVAGDSKTGHTAKADGPYFMIQLLLSLPSWVPVVQLGRSDATFNVVPVDFVVEAMARLAERDDARDRVFHLADPSAPTAAELMDLTLSALSRPRAVGSVPVGLAQRLLRLRGVDKALRIPEQSLAYLNHQATFDVSNTANALSDDLYCPRIAEYWPTLVEYARHHPEIFRRAS